jgi:hypothetical protein
MFEGELARTDSAIDAIAGSSESFARADSQTNAQYISRLLMDHRERRKRWTARMRPIPSAATGGGGLLAQYECRTG